MYPYTATNKVQQVFVQWSITPSNGVCHRVASKSAQTVIEAGV